MSLLGWSTARLHAFCFKRGTPRADRPRSASLSYVSFDAGSFPCSEKSGLVLASTAVTCSSRALGSGSVATPGPGLHATIQHVGFSSLLCPSGGRFSKILNFTNPNGIFSLLCNGDCGITIPDQRPLFGVCATPSRSSATTPWPNISCPLLVHLGIDPLTAGLRLF